MHRMMLTLLVGSLLAAAAWSETPSKTVSEGDTLAPFSAKYRVRYEGIPFSAMGVRSLERDANGTLQFRMESRAMFLRLDEQSSLSVDEDGRLRSLFYATRQKGLGRNRERKLLFDWAAARLVRSGDKPRVDPLVEGTYDPLGWQLALRRDLARRAPTPGDEFRYRVTDGGDPDDVVLVVRGTERIEVPNGSEDTLRLERLYPPEEADEEEMQLWLSPSRAWLLVRLHHVKDGRALDVSLAEAP
jgi:hypothetical protein